MTPLRLAILSIVIGLLPIIPAIIAGIMASICGCEINDAGVTGECIVFGKDISSHLYSMYVTAWFGMISVPLATCGLFISGVWALFK